MMCVSTQTKSRLILIQVSRFASHLNPGSISTPSSYGDVRLTSIQFPSHLYPSPKIHASPTSRSCWTLTHAPIFSSHIHLSDVSSPSRSWKFHLSSIQVQCQTHPGLEMCISIPSRSCATCITSLLHTNHVLPQHMSWLLHPTSIQVQKILSQLHPSPVSPYSGLMMCTSTQSRSHLSPIQMSIFVFHLYPGNVNRDSGHEICISPPKRFPLTCIQVEGFASQLHPGAMSLPFKSENLHLNSIYVLSLPHLHPGHISSQSRPKYLHVTSIQVIIITHVRHTSIQVLSHLHPNSNILISPPPMYCLTSIQVRSFVSHLHPCDISPRAYSLPFKSWYLHHSSNHVLSHTNPHLDISAWTPSRLRLTSIPRFVSHIHPSRPSTHPIASQFQLGPISTPSRSPDVRLTSIHIPSHLHSVSYSCIPLDPHRVSPPSRSCYFFISPSSRSGLISIQVARLAAQLHPCSISPHPGLKICILPPSMSCLTPSRSLDSHFPLIQVRLHLHPGKFTLQVLFLWCWFYFTCIQISISLFHPHPCTLSPPSRSEVSCLICIHVTSSRDIWITTPSMSYLTPIHVLILTPELHPEYVLPPSMSHD